MKTHFLFPPLLFAATAVSAVTINDPGFDSGFSDTGSEFTQTDNFDTWVYRSNVNSWTRPTTGGNPGGYANGAFLANGVNRTLYQGITDNKATTGLVDLTFDLNLLNNPGDGTGPLTVSIWGVETLSGSSFSLSTSAQNGTTQGDASILKSQTFNTDTGGWAGQTISDIDLGTGYDLVIVGFYSSDYISASPENDVLAIDNVSIIPEPSTIFLLGLTLLAGLLFRRRR